MCEYLNAVKTRLTKERWHAYPICMKSFYFVLTHITFPYVVEYLDALLPPYLMLTDSHRAEHTVMGVNALHHIEKNVSKDIHAWYGRADVVHAATKQHIYSRKQQVFHTLYPAMLTILPIVDKNPATESQRPPMFIKILPLANH